MTTLPLRSPLDFSLLGNWDLVAVGIAEIIVFVAVCLLPLSVRRDNQRAGIVAAIIIYPLAIILAWNTFLYRPVTSASIYFASFMLVFVLLFVSIPFLAWRLDRKWVIALGVFIWPLATLYVMKYVIGDAIIARHTKAQSVAVDIVSANDRIDSEQVEFLLREHPKLTTDTAGKRLRLEANTTYQIVYTGGTKTAVKVTSGKITLFNNVRAARQCNDGGFLIHGKTNMKLFASACDGAAAELLVAAVEPES